ncbi:hypothetical protein MPH_11710 [Macrophomina phaseolina MS6]|uniref:Zn(2)-C6 fungal-type domain-containing protein n=1 Tax=Macrophomina phaseolina (strain MS6) TaxID=1126212 RepID=K2R9T9_MACPH|nr:hypothetical protein MPH_11710 [Macrophomina phaseolina MS6]
MDEPRRTSKTVCVVCRTRKQKCDRRLPSCNFCTQSGLECRWVTAKQPGLRAGYVSELEKRLTALEKEVRQLKAGRPAPSAEDDINPASSKESSRPQSSEQSPVRSPPPTTPRPFDPMAPSTLRELCHFWFQAYHPWFPVLHEPSIMDALQTTLPRPDSALTIVFKAIAAVTIVHSFASRALSLDERQKVSTSLRNEVVMQAMGNLSLPCLQSILILTIVDCGAGKMSTLLGLRDIVVNKAANFNSLSSLPPRMLPLPSTLVSQEENVRAYWMTEILDSSSTLGVAWNLNLPQPIEHALLPCNNAIWSFSEAAMGVWPPDDLEFSSSFSLYISLVNNELWYVHNLLQQAYDMRSAEDRPKAQLDCQAVDDRLLEWKENAGSIVFAPNALFGQSAGSFDPNLLMARCMFNTAVILMYQRLTIPPHGLDHIFEPWYPAIQRCLDSCNDITAAVRSVDDHDLETTNPQIGFCIFVAARFLLVHAKHFNLEVPRSLDLLVYAIKTSGQRWPVSHRQEKVIRTALSEYKLPLSISSLPTQFFNLQYSALDIDDALHVWAEKLQPWVHLLHARPGSAGMENLGASPTAASTPQTSAAAAARRGEIGGLIGDDFVIEGLTPSAVLLDT